MFDWFFEAARPASLQEGELGASGGGGDMGDASGALNLEAYSPADPPILRQFPPDFRDQVRRLTLGAPGPRASPPRGKRLSWPGVRPNQSGQAACPSLHPQEAMQMVPKFCFPFDVERYGRKQTRS